MTHTSEVGTATELTRYDVEAQGGMSAALVQAVFRLAVRLRSSEPSVVRLRAELGEAGGALVSVSGDIPGTLSLREAQDRLCDELGRYGTVEDAVAEYVAEQPWAAITEPRYQELADAITATWERPDPVDPDEDRSDW